MTRAEGARKQRWHRKQVQKPCVDCGTLMLADIRRERCSHCATARQREQSRQHAKTYRAQPCKKCHKRLRSTDPSSGLCRRCRTASHCPDCGGMLDKSVAKKYFPCTKCTYVSVISEILWARHAVIAEEWQGFLQPLKVLCTACNEESWTSGANATKGIHPCSYCSGAEFTAREVAQVAKAAKVQPLTDSMPRSGTPWACMCLRCNRQILVTWDNVRRGRGACIYCAKQRVDNDEASSLMRMSGLEPQVSFPGARKPWKCTCQNCGGTVFPRYDNVRSGSGGCSTCATTGFRSSSPGLSYLFVASDGSYAKYGITNLDGTSDGLVRLRYLSRMGLRLSSAAEFESGWAAREAEKQLLDWIRHEQNLPYGVTRDKLPSGFTETFPMAGLSERRLRYRLTMVSRRFGGRPWRELRETQRLLRYPVSLVGKEESVL